MLCVGLILMFCSPSSPSPTDSFCSIYERVIRENTDAISLKGASDGVKRRTATNDTVYRCQCQGWDNPICKK